MSGDLQHNPNDNLIKNEFADVSLGDDLMVEATFTNPYDASEHSFSYGFFLRYDQEADEPPFLAVVVDSNGKWTMKQLNGRFNADVAEGDISNLNLLEGEKNHVMVVVTVNRARLFVNGTFAGIFYFFYSQLSPGGDVAVVTGAFAGDEKAGASTKYENFRGHGPGDAAFYG